MAHKKLYPGFLWLERETPFERADYRGTMFQVFSHLGQGNEPISRTEQEALLQ